MRLLVFAVFAMVATAQSSETFGGNIVLGRPTDRSVTVNALFTADHDSVYVEYGEQAGAYSKQTAPKAGIRANVPYQETLSDLAANTRYVYRIRYRKAAGGEYLASAEHRFQTQRPPGNRFTFTMVADSHLFTIRHCLPARYARALTNAREDNPDFHIDLGDTFRTDTIVNPRATLTYAMVVDRAIAHRPFFNLVTADAPLFLVPGNHDSEYLYYTRPESGQDANLPLWSTNARVSQYPNPVPDSFYSGDRTAYPGVVNGGLRQSYYAFTWGDALFVAIDPYWNMPAQNANNWVPVIGDAQYNWLKETLRGSRAKYKFVFAHHLLGQGRGGVEAAPQYEWGGVDPRRTQTFAQARPGWEKPIHQLFVETGVNVFFQGHDHLYARAVLDGVSYVSVPQPGAGPPGSADYFPGNETAGNFDAYLKSLTLPSSGHVRVQVAPEGVQIEYVEARVAGTDGGVNKRVADRFTVKPAAGPRMAVVSAASYNEVAFAAGQIVTLFPGTEAGITVTDSQGQARTAQVLNTSAGQTSFVIPEGTANGEATVSVPGLGSTTIRIETVAPAVFAANAGGSGVAAATALLARADGTQQAQPVFRCAGAGGCVAAPLNMGTGGDALYLSLYGTGWRNRRSLEDVVVYVGGVRAQVLYAGPQGTYAGLDQLNVKVTRDLATTDETGVVVTVDGRTANVTTVNLQ